MGRQGTGNLQLKKGKEVGAKLNGVEIKPAYLMDYSVYGIQEVSPPSSPPPLKKIWQPATSSYGWQLQWLWLA